MPVSFQSFKISLYNTMFLKITAVMAGTLALTASSWISIPLIPVPITLQTLMVLLIGIVYGWRLGGITIMAWLMEGMLGLPVLAGGSGGLLYFFGVSGGYLWALPMAGMLAGWTAEKGWFSLSTPVRALLIVMVCDILILTMGATWLALFIGVQKAYTFGVLPFLIGDSLKVILVILALRILPQRLYHL